MTSSWDLCNMRSMHSRSVFEWRAYSTQNQSCVRTWVSMKNLIKHWCNRCLARDESFLKSFCRHFRCTIFYKRSRNQVGGITNWCLILTHSSDFWSGSGDRFLFKLDAMSRWYETVSFECVLNGLCEGMPPVDIQPVLELIDQLEWASIVEPVLIRLQKSRVITCTVKTKKVCKRLIILIDQAEDSTHLKEQLCPSTCWKCGEVGPWWNYPMDRKCDASCENRAKKVFLDWPYQLQYSWGGCFINFIFHSTKHSQINV